MYKRLRILLILSAFILLTSCSSNDKTDTGYGKPENATRMVITEDGLKWDIDKSAPSFEDTIKQVSFNVKQIKLPFPPTNTSASIIKAPFDMIQLTYASLEMGCQLILVESNSEDTSEPEGKSGPKLRDGTPTWIQSDSAMSALYWRKDGLTYLLMSQRVRDHSFVPLYNEEDLAVIADSLY
ncbi:hypothetical protein MUG84_25020 [Paenibacillus sp. KQZ6P-2]|uniref:DUF4367 domain-containing protein n=1 Tax=Paenibacillus mangrovi TaxID=2931978 RepID=A0A9X1WW28_9BACL|nr:hypothetical protein [Paenibacillus mangrovi]MCJ8014950.1 hypothetical protein [Paenibacillus mangrovi]